MEGKNSRPRWYILDEQGQPVAVESLQERIDWYKAVPEHCDVLIQVGATDLGSAAISTIFMGEDQHWMWPDVESHPVLLYETMIVQKRFRERLFDRYGSRAEALEGHVLAVQIYQEEHPELPAGIVSLNEVREMRGRPGYE